MKRAIQSLYSLCSRTLASTLAVALVLIGVGGGTCALRTARTLCKDPDPATAAAAEAVAAELLDRGG